MATPQGTPEKDRLLEHSVDGIQEYDNPMPRWWLATFAGTIVFSVIYLFNVGPVGSGEGRIAEYEAEMAAAAAAHPEPTGDVSVDVLLALGQNRQALDDGKRTFTTYCAVCHRPDAGGQIGPNLTDDYWLHGGGPTDIYKVVTLGVLEKGMPPWGKALQPGQIQNVAAYVMSLKGSGPKDPKAPQGELYKP